MTSLPDLPPRRSPVLQLVDAALVRGDRMIASSVFAARAWVDRYHLSRERIAIVPHVIDTGRFAPSAVSPERINAIRQVWSLRPTDRAVLVLGRLAPDNGQMTVLEAASELKKSGLRNVVYVLAAGAGSDPSYGKSIVKWARLHGLEPRLRIVNLPPDLPATLAAMHAVVAPARQPNGTGRIVAQAQAMGRPAIVSAVGDLPENLLAPPRIAAALRTGWVVRPGDASALGRALHLALGLDPTSYQALGARACRFAEFMFVPERIAATTRSVYSSLLARDG